jgi:trans-aconitate methyltransferase
MDAMARFASSPNLVLQRHAIDLGCGDGTETLALLMAGWSVLAIDGEPAAIERISSMVPAEFQQRVEAIASRFEDAHLPQTNFVYAGYSLPFCEPQYFAGLWSNITACILPEGRFAGQLFGVRDSWSNRPYMTFHSAEQAASLFERVFEIEVFHEYEKDGEAFSGPKHWHIFDIIARKLS